MTSPFESPTFPGYAYSKAIVPVPSNKYFDSEFLFFLKKMAIFFAVYECW
jgi:hypothetical protein